MFKIDMTKPKDVVAFGRSTMDVYANEPGSLTEGGVATFSKYVGGSPANISVAMANLGLKVGFIGRVAADSIGGFVKTYLSKKGIEVSQIAEDASGVRTGITVGEFPSHAVANCYMYRERCADLWMTCQQMDENYVKDFKMIMISGCSLSHSPAREAVFLVMEYARRNDVVIALDLDYRNGTWDNANESSIYLMTAARMADIVFGTRDEFDIMEHLYMPGNQDNERSAKCLMDAGVSMVVIKRGKEGAHVYTDDGQVYTGKIYPTEVNNTFGAGDAYAGAFIYSLLNGKSIDEGLKYGAAASSITIAGHGCSQAMPDLETLEAFVRTRVYGGCV